MLPDDEATCLLCAEQIPPRKKPGGNRKIYCSRTCMNRAHYAAIQQDPTRLPRRRAYDRWYRMMNRCDNPENPHWARYGGRGIYVVDAWRDFETYYADTGDAPEGMTLDRIDNNGPYSPANTRWATAVQQRANQEYDHMRIKTHCKSGHPFDEVNTHIDRRGWRSCRTCARAKTARQRAARKAVNNGRA